MNRKPKHYRADFKNNIHSYQIEIRYINFEIGDRDISDYIIFDVPYYPYGDINFRLFINNIKEKYNIEIREKYIITYSFRRDRKKIPFISSFIVDINDKIRISQLIRKEKLLKVIGKLKNN